MRNLLIIYVLSLICSVSLFIAAPKEMNNSFITFNLIMVGISVYLFIKNVAKFYKNAFLPSVIFLIAYIIVHFQYLLLYVLGFDVDSISFIDVWVNKEVVSKSLTISNIGILSFLLGYQLSYNFKKKVFIPKESFSIVKIVGNKLLVFLSWIFFIIFLLLVGGDFLGGNYDGGKSWSVFVKFSFYLFEIFLTSAIVLGSFNISNIVDKKLSFREYIGAQGKHLSLLVFVYAVLFLLIGARSGVLFILFLYIWPYVLLGKKAKLNLISLIFLIAFGSFLMSLVQTSRNIQGEFGLVERFQKVYMQDDLQSDSSLLFTDELASSVRCLHIAVDNVGSKHDFTYGLFQLRYLVSSFPFAGFFISNLVDDRYQYLGSAQYLTYIDQGINRSYGIGTTPVADLYVDFGVFGVLIGFILFGYFFQIGEFYFFRNYKLNIFLWGLVLIYFSGTFMLSRSYLLNYTKTAIIVFLIIYFNQILFGKYGKNYLKKL